MNQQETQLKVNLISHTPEPEKLISGGPMMGFGMFDLNVPTTKTASALLSSAGATQTKTLPTPLGSIM